MTKKLNKPDQSLESAETGVKSQENKQQSTTQELVGELSLGSKSNDRPKFMIPVSPGIDSDCFHQCGSTLGDTELDCSAFERSFYPGIYKNGNWEGCLSLMEEDTFVLFINYYDQDLYTVVVQDNDSWNQEKYPASSYPDEMKDLLWKISEKRDISFPLIDGYFKSNNIILNKKQIKEFLEDIKINPAEVFKHSDEKVADTQESSFVVTEDGYQIKNILPTDFADYGTFSKENISLEKANNGEIYVQCLMQDVGGKNITKAGLEKLIESMQLIYLPENKVYIYMKPTLTNHFSRISVEMKWNDHNEYGNLIDFLQKNLRKQYDIAKKWNIYMPLVSGLKLDFQSHSITLDQSKLPDFIKDLGIDPKTVVLPK